MQPPSGLTADLYRRRTAPAARKRSVLPVITLAVLVVSFSAVGVTMMMFAQGTTSFVLAHQTVASNWDVETHQLIAYDDPALPEKVLVTLHESEFAQCCLLSFIGFDIPFNFSEATFTIPVVWYAASGNESIPLSIYEVRGPWLQWTSDEQTDGVTWDGIARGNPVVDRVPLDTVRIDQSTFGYGTSTDGVLSLNVTRAIEDWFAGDWNPSYGFLVATVAPWESLSTALPDDYIVTVQMLARDANIVIYDSGGVPIPIPEFSSIVPLVAVIAVVALARRRTVSNNIVVKDDAPRTALSPSNALPETETD